VRKDRGCATIFAFIASSSRFPGQVLMAGWMMAERELRASGRAKQTLGFSFANPSFRPEVVVSDYGDRAGAAALLYSFEKFELDTATRELRRDSELLSVEPKVFDLLSYLIANRERVVSKDDLIASVWNGRIVSDAALTSCLNAARTALGDTGEEQR